MKVLKYFPILLGFIAASCEDEVGPKMLAEKLPSTITAPSAGKAFVLTQDKMNEVADTFTWTAADFGYQAGSAYTIQMAKAGTKFEGEVADIVEVFGLSAKVSVKDLNNAALTVGIPYNEKGEVEIRIKASVSKLVDAVYSEPIKLTITPFEMIINYPKIWVPGSFTGWGDAFKPATEAVAYSVKNDGVYENYFWIPSTNAEFKFTRVPDWKEEIAYGGTPGILTNGGSNIPVGNTSQIGIFLVRANLNTMTYVVKHYEFGIIGNAVPGDWGKDNLFTWNAEKRVLEATIQMQPGKFKIREAGNWDFAYGAGKNKGEVELGGKDIEFAGAAGLYKFTFHVMSPIKKYTIDPVK